MSDTVAKFKKYKSDKKKVFKKVEKVLQIK